MGGFERFKTMAAALAAVTVLAAGAAFAGEYLVTNFDDGTNLNNLGYPYYLFGTGNPNAGNVDEMALVVSAGRLGGSLSYIPQSPAGGSPCHSGSYCGALRVKPLPAVNVNAHYNNYDPNHGYYPSFGIGMSLTGDDLTGYGPDFQKVDSIVFWAMTETPGVTAFFNVNTIENSALGPDGDGYRPDFPDIAKTNRSYNSYRFRFTARDPYIWVRYSFAIKPVISPTSPGTLITNSITGGGRAGDLAQEPWWGTQVDFKPENVTQIAWGINSDTNLVLYGSEANIYIDDVKFVGAQIDGNFGAIPASSKPVITYMEIPHVARVGEDCEWRVNANGSNITWSMSGSVPPGLEIRNDLGSHNGRSQTLIKGYPMTAGTYTFTVRAANATGSDTKEITVVIEPQAKPEIKGTAISDVGQVGVEFSWLVAASGYVENWLIHRGALPPGLQLDLEGVYQNYWESGVYIRGIPTQAGEYTFAVVAANDAGYSEPVEFAIEIQGLQKPHISDANLPPEGHKGVIYSWSINGSGYNTIWSHTGGLPPGLELTDDGHITGIPTAVGEYDFVVRAANAAGFDEKEFTVTVIELQKPVITTTELETGKINENYFVYVEAEGYNITAWGVVSGSLPPGLRLNPGSNSAYIYGRPTEFGIYTFSLRATNVVGNDTKTFTITVIAPPVITTAALPSGENGVTYSASLSATGEDIGWSYSGNLPPGLVFDESTGRISGAPSGTGEFEFTVYATNAAGVDGKDFTIEIIPLQPPVITATSLPNGAKGVSYSVKIGATGSNVGWSLVSGSGSLPPPLELDASTGTISGTPTGTGTFTFTVKVENLTAAATKELSIVVIESYTITFNAGEGVTVSPSSGLTGGSGTVSLPTPSRTGYSFSGWYTAASGGEQVTDSKVYTASTTIYARWTINTYTVTFNSQSGSAVSSQTVTHGGKATEPSEPTREGYTFGGWYKESGATNAWSFASDAVTSNVTIYAKWTVDPTSVLESDRVVPTKPTKEATVIAPVSQLSGEFTAGPNPVARQSGEVKFYRQGKHILASELRIYDINGNVINKVKISDNKTVGSQSRRQVGKWDLKDSKGNTVSEGTYLVKGALKANGKSEKVSVILSVR